MPRNKKRLTNLLATGMERRNKAGKPKRWECPPLFNDNGALGIVLAWAFVAEEWEETWQKRRKIRVRKKKRAVVGF